MKQTKKWALAVTVSGMALVLCSCSTAASNANRYFTSVGAIATNLMNSGKVSNGSTASAASENTAAALPTPGDFTMSEDGTYSFTGVDGAGLSGCYAGRLWRISGPRGGVPGSG